jgi:hypothetical protein
MATFNTLRFRITGVSPLVMRNGQLANPLNRFAKDIRTISGKRRKTEADYEEMARLEFLGALYLSSGEPCLPGELIEACIVRGAVSKRRGKSAKAGILCPGVFPLQYDGPRNPLDLWEREEFRLYASVKLGNSRIIRTRPIFRNWSAEIGVRYNPSLLNGSEVKEFLFAAGELEGLGDWRPRFGQFDVTDLNSSVAA